MLPSSRARLPSLLTHINRSTAILSSSACRTYSTPRTDNPVPVNIQQDQTPGPPQNVSDTNARPTTAGGAKATALQEDPKDAERRRQMQAPNREKTWARSQRPRSEAMVGPRFEQTIIEQQPRPYAAIELIHKQPVRWTHERIVSCDGGGGPLGHPRIFINTDKPQICWCTYCGVPFANEHNRKYLESLPSTTYPLEPQGDSAEVPTSQRITDEAYGQR